MLCHESAQLNQNIRNPCDIFQNKQETADDRCHILNDKTFQECSNIIDNTNFIKNCQYDICHGSQEERSCSTIADYVKACEAKGVQVPNWRTLTGCEIKCPGILEYKSCGVEATCQNNNPVTKDCKEGCFCPKGYYLENDSSTCVKLEECS